MATYTPALAQTIEAPAHHRTGRPRWARAIYAADGTLLDVIVYDEIDWPRWTTELVQLQPVKVTATEFKHWTAQAALTRVSEDDVEKWQ